MSSDKNNSSDFDANVNEIIAAYLGNSSNRVDPKEVPDFIRSVRNVMRETGTEHSSDAAAPEKHVPAVSVKKSITPDHLISLIDGKPYKSLKRHLTTHGLDPVSYRERYNLPADYPMVSENYSKQRAALAQSTGLGKRKTEA